MNSSIKNGMGVTLNSNTRWVGRWLCVKHEFKYCGRLNVHCVGLYYSNWIHFFVMFLQVPSIDSICFSAYVGFIGDHFFLLSTDSTYSNVPGDQGGPIFFRQDVFLALALCTNWCTTICITCLIFMQNWM